MKKLMEDYRSGGPNSNRATYNQISRMTELKIEFHRDITWLEAKALIKAYHQNKRLPKKK